MSVKRPPVICPYLEIMEQHKQYQQHAKRISSARSCVESKQPQTPRQFSYYLNKYKDTDKKTRLKKPTQIKSARGATSKKKLSDTDNWMTQLNDVVLPRQRGTIVSPSAVLLFPSPVVPNSRTPETLRQIIDDSGLKVLDESPLSARDSYYAKDIQSLMIKPPGPAFNVKPSPRPRSMRKNEDDDMKVSRPNISQSERQQRPTIQIDKKLDEEQEAQAKKKYEEQKKKFDEINLDEFNLDKFNVSKEDNSTNTNKGKREYDPLDDIDSLLNNNENNANTNEDKNNNDIDLNELDKIIKNVEDDNSYTDENNIDIDEIDNILNNDAIKKLGTSDSNNIEIDINTNDGETKEIIQPSSPKRETMVTFQLPEFANNGA